MADELSSAFSGRPSIVPDEEVRQLLTDSEPLETEGLDALQQRLIAEKLGVSPEEVRAHLPRCHCEWPPEFAAKVDAARDKAEEIRRARFLREVLALVDKMRPPTLSERVQRIWNRLIH